MTEEEFNEFERRFSALILETPKYNLEGLKVFGESLAYAIFTAVTFILFIIF